MVNNAILNMLRQMQAQKSGPQTPPGMAYNPGPMRQFTPSPQPQVPFMPAPQVGPQEIPTGGIAGLGGQPNIMPPPPGMGPAPLGGPQVHPPAPPMSSPQDLLYALEGKPSGMKKIPTNGLARAMKGFNPQMGQIGMGLLQRARQQPMPWQNLPVFRGGGR